MKKFLIFVLSITFCFSLLTGNTNSFTFSNGWKITYSIVGDYINIETSVNNKGNIGFGFGGTKMNDIDVALLTYQGSSVLVQDRNYINPPNGNPKIVSLDTERSPPGTADFEDKGSTYNPNTGDWHIIFRRKLKTGDIWDNEIKDGKDMQISIAIFGQFEWGKKHTFREDQVVHLTSAKLNASTGTGESAGASSGNNSGQQSVNSNSNSGSGSGTSGSDTNQSTTFSSIIIFTLLAIFSYIH